MEPKQDRSKESGVRSQEKDNPAANRPEITEADVCAWLTRRLFEIKKQIPHAASIEVVVQKFQEMCEAYPDRPPEFNWKIYSQGDSRTGFKNSYYKGDTFMEARRKLMSALGLHNPVKSAAEKRAEAAKLLVEAEMLENMKAEGAAS